MSTAIPTGVHSRRFHSATLPAFLRADAGTRAGWVKERNLAMIAACAFLVILGGGCYGGALGSWIGLQQAIFTGTKLPLVLLLTTLGNGALNAMLAPLLGMHISFKQSLALVLLSFALASAILGALAPVALFIVWNTSPLDIHTHLNSIDYSFLQLTITMFVAMAGIAGNVKLLPVLRELSANPPAARKVLLSWLCANLFLGSQIAWLLRPFIWDPDPVSQFIGSQYLHGSFYETIFEAIRRLLV
jgi:hypothetical protein